MSVFPNKYAHCTSQTHSLAPFYETGMGHCITILKKNVFSLFQNDSIDPETFTFEKFFKIYQSLCPRTDIDDLFSQM